MFRFVLITVLVMFSLPSWSVEAQRKSGSGYYVDKDGDSARDTDRTEPFYDFHEIEVPGDYATIQLALDSNDVKQGTLAASIGGSVFVHPGVYTESFEIGGATSAEWQYSVSVRGAGPGGFEADTGENLCATTLLGNDQAANTVIKVDGSIGWRIADLCIDMDDAVNNDPSIGIHVGYSSHVAKHGVIENVNIQGGDSSTIGIKLGDSTSGSDTAFNTLRNIRVSKIGLGVLVDAQQTVDNVIDVIECSNPIGSIGCVSVGSHGGNVEIRNAYMSTTTANQVGINIRNEAVGATIISNPKFEWAGDAGSMIRFEDPGTNTGAYRAHTILGGRFQPQNVNSTGRYCIELNRVGQLLIVGASFESNASNMKCRIKLNNPSPDYVTEVTIIGIDVQWNGTQTDMLFDVVDAGGGIRVNMIDGGQEVVCTPTTGNGQTFSLGNSVCKGISAGISTATSPSANDSSTQIATTAYVQGEINGAAGTGMSCSGGACGVTSAVTMDTEWDTLTEIETVVSKNILDTTETSAYSIGTSAPVDGSTACSDGDIFLDKSAKKIYYCTDGATDKWYGTAMVDTP